MTETRTFPLNTWYAAAWAHEIEHDLNARKICDINMVLYRKSDGEVAALEDACWHRLLPLSMGRLNGDEVVCGYHGLVFNPDGQCTHMPAQKSVNSKACVRAFPAVERHRLIWVWPGDPALADSSTIPDFHWNDGTEWVGKGDTYYSLKCDYRLVIDNLMDLTHETYVHQGSIGDEEITSASFDIAHTDDTASISRWMMDIEPPPHWAKQLKRPGNVDRWQIVTFQKPSVIVGDVGVAVAGTGAPDGDRSQGVNGAFLAAITPETETTCHYFWNFVRTFAKDDEQLTHDHYIGHVNDGEGIYDEDKSILEAQQKSIDENPDLVFRNINTDGAGVWARRILEGMIAEEAGQQAALESEAAE